MKTITLNNGVEMPLQGFGVFQIAPQDCEKAVRNALDVGYRMIDTAQAYYNEEGVGRAWRASGMAREELFLVTKVWISNAGDERAAKSIDESLRKLQTDYIDLLLIHQPFGDYYGTYRAMQKALTAGKVRAIGLSNFYDARFVDLGENMDVKPAVVQLEANVFTQQKSMRKLMASYGTHLMAWAPLAEGQYGIFTNPTLTQIGAKYGKTAAQTALRFLMAENIVAIPKSVHRERLLENLTLDDFELSDQDLEAIRALDGGKPLFADFNDPSLAKFLLEFDSKFNPQR
jgi:2,5-diketo-D-gluconate reductase A